MRDRRTIRAALLLLPAVMLCAVPILAQQMSEAPAPPQPPGDRPAATPEKVSRRVDAQLRIEGPPGRVSHSPAQMDYSDIHKMVADAGYRLELGQWRMHQDAFLIRDIVLVPIRDDAEADYGAVFERIADRVREHLATLAREQAQPLDEARRRAKDAENAVGELQAKLRKHRLDIAGRGILLSGLEEQTARLYDMRLTLQVDLEGMKARRAAILRHLTEQKERLAEKRDRQVDVQMRYLEKSLAVREADYQRLLEANTKTPGVVPASDIQQAKLQVERAKSQIEAIRERPEHEGAGGELLVGLTRQLIDVDIEMAGAETRRRFVDALFTNITSEETRAAVDRFVSLEREVRRAERLHEAARDELVKIEQQNAALRLTEVRIDVVARHEVKGMENPEREGGRPRRER